MCLDCQCSVVGNLLDTILAPNHPSSPEGIYTKCSKSIVMGNIILDCPGREGCINMKGEDSGDYSSEESICEANNISFRTLPTESCVGINLGSPNINCVGNTIAKTKKGIVAGYDCLIQGNKILKVQTTAIEVIPGVTDTVVVIKNNTIKTTGKVANDCWGILYTLSGSLVAKSIEVSNNTIIGFVGNVRLPMRFFNLSSGAVGKFICKGNTISDGDYACLLTSGVFTYVDFSDNTMHAIDNPTIAFFTSATSTASSLIGNSHNGGKWNVAQESITQATSRTTGVTLNAMQGAITLVSAAGSATYQSFTVTNSLVLATDTPRVSQKSGTDLYETFVTNVAAGSFKVTFRTTGGTTTEQPVLQFSIN
jgi:hypothetical protein